MVGQPPFLFGKISRKKYYHASNLPSTQQHRSPSLCLFWSTNENNDTPGVVTDNMTALDERTIIKYFWYTFHVRYLRKILKNMLTWEYIGMRAAVLFYEISVDTGAHIPHISPVNESLSVVLSLRAKGGWLSKSSAPMTSLRSIELWFGRANFGAP